MRPPAPFTNVRVHESVRYAPAVAVAEMEKVQVLADMEVVVFHPMEAGAPSARAEQDG